MARGIILSRRPGGSGGGGSGVSSLAESGQAALTGAVTLSEGAGITLTQAGQDIEIASAGVGQEVAYEERTTVFTTTATTEGTAAVVVTADAFVADGASAYLIEFYAPRWFGSAANAQCNLIIHDGTNSLGFFYMGTLATTAEVMGVYAQRRLVPTAGSKTYSIRAYTSAATTLTISAGSGGAAAFVPAFVRITKVT